MKEQQPKSIKTVGLLVIIFSGFIIFSNGMGALAWTAMGMSENASMTQSADSDPLSFLFEHYVKMCLTMVGIGITYLLGGIYIRKHKLWASKLVSFLSGLLFAIIWGLMIALSVSIRKQEGMELFTIGAVFTALIWSAPIGLLIWFLNRPKIKKYFA